MDDEKRYTIQVKGTAYRLLPVSNENRKMIGTLQLMGASEERQVKALFKVLERCAGPEQWDQWTDRLVSLELTIEDFVGAFKRLMERQLKDVAETSTDAE